MESHRSVTPFLLVTSRWKLKSISVAWPFFCDIRFAPLVHHPYTKTGCSLSFTFMSRLIGLFCCNSIHVYMRLHVLLLLLRFCSYCSALSRQLLLLSLNSSAIQTPAHTLYQIRFASLLPKRVAFFQLRWWVDWWVCVINVWACVYISKAPQQMRCIIFTFAKGIILQTCGTDFGCILQTCGLTLWLWQKVAFVRLRRDHCYRGISVPLGTVMATSRQPCTTFLFLWVRAVPSPVPLICLLPERNPDTCEFVSFLKSR